jgi:L-aspartate oxidase
MEKYHRDKELAPRDVVARAIAEEIIVTSHDCVYLDMTHKDGDWLKERFPTIYKHCLEKKIDITESPIPVVPAAHYTCGGVKTDLKGRTNLKGLYAVGEVACTGLHGANRLASTSLLEGLTWGYLAAIDIQEHIAELRPYPSDSIKDWVEGHAEAATALIQQDWHTLKQTMWNYVGLTRTTNRLDRAEAMFKELSDEIQDFYKNAGLVDSLIGLRNAVEVGYLVLKASRRNQESIGCFYRK